MILSHDLRQHPLRYVPVSNKVWVERLGTHARTVWQHEPEVGRARPSQISRTSSPIQALGLGPDMKVLMVSLRIDHVIDATLVPPELHEAGSEEISAWIDREPELLLWLFEVGLSRATIEAWDPPGP